jgi:hypothetical protein
MAKVGGAPEEAAGPAAGRDPGGRTAAPAGDDPLCTFPTSRRHLRKQAGSPPPKVVEIETLTG